jgi:hypothetical protein
LRDCACYVELSSPKISVRLHPQSLRDCACYVERSSPLGLACIRSPEGLRMLRFTPHLVFLLSPCWGALRVRLASILDFCLRQNPNMLAHPFRVKLRGGVHRVPPLSSPTGRAKTQHARRAKQPFRVSEHPDSPFPFPTTLSWVSSPRGWGGFDPPHLRVRQAKRARRASSACCIFA